jgi:organic hydroperoxide reductase OsmC/OhrA
MIMHRYPHRYFAVASARVEGDIVLDSNHLPPLVTAAPEEFGGPGGRWSPETLCVGAVADCFALTFRSVARSLKLSWLSLRCEVEGTLDRPERTPQFTHFALRATLVVPPGVDEAEARRALERAEQGCLITRSLKGSSHLEPTVETRAPA